MTNWNAESIKDEAKTEGLTINSFLALHRNVDPFYVDLPLKRVQARWFANVWKHFHCKAGQHLRGIHYMLVNEKTSKRSDSQPYQNTEIDWHHLLLTSQYARYLGYIDPDMIVDHRNDPVDDIHGSRADTPEPSWEHDFDSYNLSVIDSFSAFDPNVSVAGYDYQHADQNYRLEVWIEKSTMRDILLPICREMGASLMVGTGMESMTQIRHLLRRAAEKPTRIFYISDYDTNGIKMPIQVARQIQFWIQREQLDVDIKLQALMLTKDQIKEYDLPRMPRKAKGEKGSLGRAISQGRHDAFKTRHGEGYVELDAMYAIHPAEFRRIVREALEPYFDQELENRLAEAENEAEEAARNAVDDIHGSHRKEIASLEEQVNAILKRYSAEIQPLKEQLDSLGTTIKEELDEAQPELPDRPKPETDADECDEEWLFDSARDYLEQNEFYQRANPVVPAAGRG